LLLTTKRGQDNNCLQVNTVARNQSKSVEKVHKAYSRVSALKL